MRERLIVDLQVLNSTEDAANWAHRVLGAKNSLTAADAEHVEQAFQLLLANLTSEPEPQVRPLGRGRSSAEPLLSTKAYWRCRQRVGFAIGNMSKRLQGKRVWPAAVVLLMRTI